MKLRLPIALLMSALLLGSCAPAHPDTPVSTPPAPTVKTPAATASPAASSAATAMATPTPTATATAAAFSYTPKADSALPEPLWSSLPQWHGVNLTHLCDTSYTDGVFVEKEFQLLSKQGFNFARIPLDYRFWAPADDWGGVKENLLRTLDDAVRWGTQYDIHLSLDLHRAPGYCINPPSEKESLWTSAAAQDAACRQWAMLARRYKDVPNRNMSFNLLNEPSGVDEDTYVKVVTKLVNTIRAEDPDRLIIADGLETSTVPVPRLKELKIAQALHNYKPMMVTHYKASWVEGSDAFPVPTWPLYSLSAYLYGPTHPDLASPIVIDGPLAQDATLTLHVNQVSNLARLQVLCDGNIVYDETIRCTDDPASCKEVQYSEQWGIYQNIYDRDYTADIPKGTQQIQVRIQDGDWLTLTRLTLRMVDGTQAVVDYTGQQWGDRAPCFALQDGKLNPTANAGTLDRAWLREQMQPWVDLKNSGVGVMVGEWGVYNQTPHDVTLRYMADAASVYQECGFGWALWNYYGGFGIIDSGRSDVKYTTFDSVKLDQELYDVIKP